ncbi:MAG: hypothetical protein MNPFHGCM_00549 [Gemmatimonadaceae bacterium]|nr:hypothetical protein [Gemmatimonadaceae bacterium]
MTTSRNPARPVEQPGLEVARTQSRLVERFLRVPLAAKIAGANAIIVVAAIVTALVVTRMGQGIVWPPKLAIVLAIALAVASVVNVVLVLVALRPLNDLEVTAQRIWRGDLSARVPHSNVADTDLLRIGGAVNALLDGLISDRARLRAMASHVMQAGDAERARIASELHDSAAQTLAGLAFELSAIARSNQDEALTARIERARQITAGVLDEIKMLAHTMYPRILEHGDLVPALEHLAREVTQRTRIPVVVKSDGSTTAVPVDLVTVFYRVAQEAVSNAVRHGHPGRVVIDVTTRAGVTRLDVEDDGTGFDVVEAESRRPGMGIYTMRERAALVGGGFEIQSARGQVGGTRITMTVPTEVSSNGQQQRRDGMSAVATSEPGVRQ